MPPLQPILSSLRQPLLADLLQPRIGAITIAGTAALQLLAATHGMGLPCPFHDYLGIPCPGCGLTRSLLALAHGNLLDSLAWHPYGILLAASLAAATAAALLPTTPRTRLITAIATLERKTALLPLALALLLPLWLIRLTGILPLHAA